MISGKFVKTSVIYTLAGALPTASAIILLPLYIHHLSTDLYGVLSLYMALALFVQILVTFSFDTSLYIHYHEFKTDKKKLAAFGGSVFVTLLLIGFMVLLLFSAVGDPLLGLMGNAELSFYPYGLAAVGSGIGQAIFRVYSAYLQSSEKPVVYFWSNVLSFSFIVVFTVSGLELFPATLIGPVFGRLLASTMSAGWVLLRVFREFGFHRDFSWLKESLSFNFYTFIYQILLWVNNYFDRFLLLIFVALHDVGVYDFAFKVLIPLELLLTGVYNSFYPKVVSQVIGQEVKRSTPEITRYYHGLVALMMLLVTGTILVLPWIIGKFVGRAEYQESIAYIPYMALLYLFKTIRLFFFSPYTMLKYTRPLPAIYLVISLVKIGLVVALASTWGIYAVIAASFVAAVVELFLLTWRIGGRFKFQFNAFKLIVAPLFLTAVVVVVEAFAGANTFIHLRHLGYLVLSGCLLLWFYRKELPLIRLSFR